MFNEDELAFAESLAEAVEDGILVDVFDQARRHGRVGVRVPLYPVSRTRADRVPTPSAQG